MSTAPLDHDQRSDQRSDHRSAQRPARSPARRVLSTARLVVANRWTTLYTPLVILGGLLAGHVVVWALIRRATGGGGEAAISGFQYSGATLYLFVYMAIVAVQAMNGAFGLALGFGATRRDFLLGAGLVFLVLSVGYSLLYLLLVHVERWTGGWGFGGSLFFGALLDDTGAVLYAAAVFSGFALSFALGTLAGAAYVRAKTAGVLVVLGALGVLLLGAAVVVTYTGSWQQTGQALAGLGWWSGSGLLLLAAAALGAVGHLVLLRATPRG